MIPYRPLPLDLADVQYEHGPDSQRKPGVPIGELVEFEWCDSKVYPGTYRKFWVHVPAQYDSLAPASLMVVQDGMYYLDPAGQIRLGIVLDNLLHKKEIPVTITVFVDPGVLEDGGRNRNEEYDAFDDRYVTFLLDEIIPRVAARWSIVDDPNRWALVGGSSSGNCSFTAAWLRPDRFRRVFAGNSSWLQMPNGNPYLELIPKTERKPIRLFLQISHRDLRCNEPERNWFAENLRMAATLAEAGYDFRLVLGDGGHGPNFCGVVLPDALRWLWIA